MADYHKTVQHEKGQMMMGKKKLVAANGN